MIIPALKAAAKSVGVSAFITDSDRGIDTQLTRITKVEQLPIMLISWDMERDLSFDSNGFLNPSGVKVVCLLLTKPETMEKDEAEESAEKMGILFEQFLQHLYSSQSSIVRPPTSPITGANYKLLPWYGIAKHSGVLGRFTVGVPTSTLCL